MNAERVLQKVENELDEISKQLEALLDHQSKLEEKKAMLDSQMNNRKEKLLESTDWNSKRVTLVVSPLVSLMEDQLMALTRLHVQAKMFGADTGIKDATVLLKEMTNPSSLLKLLYVTPEKVSKRFMANLEKMYTMGRLERIAIDEVHCCSQWGHDFRPDYKFLRVMKRQFPGIPLLGLTATSTTSVTHDVQKMLNIPGCLVLRASVNRPNLNYMVLPKPSNTKEALDALAEMIKRKYNHDSGIIYCCSIKDCDDIAKELRLRNIKVGSYHATLKPAARSKVHQAWSNNEIKLVVATVAFGVGIDKPDVRYVIHYSISKSMENYYQESGRAGRDDQPSDCVIFYRFNDIFRQSTMVFAEQTGLDNLHAFIAYCIDGHRCRRSLIATHFGEEWTPAHCQKMCDHCRSAESQVVKEDITKYCLHLYTILDEASGKAEKQNLTGMMLVEAWMGKGASNHQVKSVPVPNFSRELCERIVAHLIIKGFLREDFHLPPYSTRIYIVLGPRAPLVKSGKLRVELEIAQPASKTTATATITKPTSATSTPKSTFIFGVSTSSSSSLSKSANHHSTDSKEKTAQRLPVKVNSSGKKVVKGINKKVITNKNSNSVERKGVPPVKRKVFVSNSSDSDSDFDPQFSEPKKKRLKSTNHDMELD